MKVKQQQEGVLCGTGTALCHLFVLAVLVIKPKAAGRPGK
jgi:hypothetical protein